MRYLNLVDPRKIGDWARTLVNKLEQRDAAQDERLKAIEARLTAGGL